MKLLGLLFAAAGLTGCVAYPYAAGPGYASQSYYGNGGYYAPAPYVVEQPSYFYGGVYSSGGRGPAYRDRDRGWRDRDHDGVPNRYDRDRDGDGVPNRLDSRPNDPRRR